MSSKKSKLIKSQNKVSNKNNGKRKKDSSNNDDKYCKIKVRNTGAKKYDEKKPKFSMLPQKALLEVSRSFTHGAKKYGKFNYSNPIEYTRLTDAAQRHINKALMRKDYDEDSGDDKLYHIANAIASLMMLLDNQITGVIIDDRNPIY